MTQLRFVTALSAGAAATALSMAWSQPAHAEACEVSVLSPADGETTSLTPTIRFEERSRQGCEIDAWGIVINPSRGDTVYSHGYDPDVGLLTGQARGPDPFEHQVPAGQLEAGVTYTLVVSFTDKPGDQLFRTQRDITSTRLQFTTRARSGQGEGQTGTPPRRANHTIVISGRGNGTDYTIFGGGRLDQVGGQLAGRSVSIQNTDEVSGDLARGAVGAGLDGFNVYGNLPSIVLDDPDGAAIEVDGQTFHQIVISSENISGDTGYTISGGGRLEQVDGRLMGYDVTIQGNDRVQGNRADGEVGGGADGFRVYGASPSIELENPDNAVVFVNGEPK